MNRFFFKGDNDKWYMTRCPKCHRENWGMAVSSGTCAWCGITMEEYIKENPLEIYADKDFIHIKNYNGEIYLNKAELELLIAKYSEEL